MSNATKSAKRVFVSDIHINEGRSHANAKKSNSKKGKAKKHPYEWLGKKEVKRFAEFLAYMNQQDDISEFILLGDALDDWVYPVDEVPPSLEDILAAPINEPIMKQFKIMSKNKRVVYLPGNHDMGMTAEILHRHLPDMAFGGSAMRDSVYRTSRLRAEHGSAHAMFNAPMPPSYDGARLPLGYYISRVVAFRERETGNKDRHYWAHAIEQLFKYGPQTLASYVFEVVLSEAGLSGDTEIIMPEAAGQKRSITAAEVTERYRNLYEQWEKLHGPGQAFKAILAEVGQLGILADGLCQQSDTNIVIFGHSHDWKLDKDSWFVDERLYANCGTWCEEDRPCTYVQTEKNDGKRTHRVKVFKWADQKPELLDEEEISR